MKRTTPLEEFKRLSAVPRRSYYNEKIIAYCIGRAKELGLFCYYDEKNQNVLIRKDAAPGKENCPGIVLQGHLDMVAEQDPDVSHNWDEDGLTLLEEGDFLTADGTTLGADNGVAPALAFALLTDDSLQNPPLEVFLTTNEEVGMDSVKDADLSYLQGKYLINLDGGVEDEFVIGCCGGQTLMASVKEEREEAKGTAYTISVSGLKGGHSGIEIGKERANALKVLGQVLSGLSNSCSFRLIDLRAEGKDNAISKAAEADLLVLSGEDEAAFSGFVEECSRKQSVIYRTSDPDLSISLKPLSNESQNALSQKASNALTFLLEQLPFGVLNHEQCGDGSIETSANLGLVKKENGRIGIVISLRSSVAERLAETAARIESLCRIAGAECAESEKAYPAWLPDYDSPLIPLMRDVFVSMYGKEPKIGPIHAGLECGYLLANSNLEAALSTGPNIYGEHTTEEKLSISSLNRTLAFVKAVLERV